MTVDEEVKGGTRGDSSGCSWAREEDKAFENAIASWDEGDWDRYSYSSEFCVRIAGEVPGKSLEEIWCHYEYLVEDACLIESSQVEIHRYDGKGGFVGSSGGGEVDGGKEGGGKEGKVSKSENKRRKGIPCAEEEHR